MIRHCVLCRFRADVGSEARQDIHERLAVLCDSLPNVLSMGFGPNVSPEGGGQGFDEGFVIDFVDETARDAYLVDEVHRGIGADLVALLEGGEDGLVVFDLAMQTP